MRRAAAGGGGGMDREGSGDIEQQPHSLIYAQWNSSLCDCVNACRCGGGGGDTLSAVLACLFPCWLHGWIVSQAEHEEPLSGCNHSSCQLGRKGCATCFGLGVAHLVLWPVSPTTVLYTCWQRRQMSQLYGIQRRSWRQCCLATCCAPCALYQHVKFMQNEKKYDTIRFPWEKEDVAAMALKPPTVTIKAVLLGDSEVGKTALFRWYLGQRVRCSTTKARVTIGTREISSDESRIVFLELWDIPVDGDDYPAEPVLSDQPVLLLLFDPLVRNSFAKAAEIFAGARETAAELHKNNSKVPATLSAVMVATHADVWEHFLCDESARPPDMFQENMSAATGWCEEQEVPLINVSCITGANCKLLIRTVLRVHDDEMQTGVG